LWTAPGIEKARTPFSPDEIRRSQGNDKFFTIIDGSEMVLVTILGKIFTNKKILRICQGGLFIE